MRQQDRGTTTSPLLALRRAQQQSRTASHLRRMRLLRVGERRIGEAQLPNTFDRHHSGPRSGSIGSARAGCRSCCSVSCSRPVAATMLGACLPNRRPVRLVHHLQRPAGQP